MNPQSQDNFGVPKTDSTPVGIVGMEGQLFRGIANNTSPRPMWVRIVAILFCTMVFLLPGVFLLLLVIVEFSQFLKDSNILGMLVISMLGLILTGAGVMGIKANVFRKKEEKLSPTSI